MSNPAYVYAPTTGSTAYVNDGLNRVTSVGGTAVGYNWNQEITSALGNSYGYDAAGRLLSAAIGGGGYSFEYDPADRLYSSYEGRFQYAGVQLTGEYDSVGALTARHVPGPGLDQPVASYSGGGRVQQIADERGSVIGVAGSGGAVSINRYDEYGVPAAASSGRFQYTGQARMAPGLYNYRARAYAPELGRFLQTDPIGYAAGMNLYAYVGGDPVNLVDPLGLCGIPGEVACPIDEVVVVGERPRPRQDRCDWFCKFSRFVFPPNDDPRPANENGPGSHRYDVPSPICVEGGSCTEGRVYECLVRYPAPGANGRPVREGGRTYVNVLGVIRGTVSHSVSPGTLTVVNSTLPDHTLYPGVVIRSVETVEAYGRTMIYIQSTGYGTGPNALANELPSGLVWNSNDGNIRQCVSSGQ